MKVLVEANNKEVEGEPEENVVEIGVLLVVQGVVEVVMRKRMFGCLPLSLED